MPAAAQMRVLKRIIFFDLNRPQEPSFVLAKLALLCRCERAALSREILVLFRASLWPQSVFWAKRHFTVSVWPAGKLVEHDDNITQHRKDEKCPYSTEQERRCYFCNFNESKRKQHTSSRQPLYTTSRDYLLVALLYLGLFPGSEGRQKNARV